LEGEQSKFKVPGPSGCTGQYPCAVF